MTFYRHKLLKKFYRCYLVRPIGDFNPTNWRQAPKRFSMVESKGATLSAGQADAFRFLHNHAAIESGKLDCWAIWLTD